MQQDLIFNGCLNRNLFFHKKTTKIWSQSWGQSERKIHHPKNNTFLVLSLPFVMQFKVQFHWVSFKFFPPSTFLCPGGWESGLSCPSLLLDPLLSWPLIFTLDADSNASQPALNKKKRRGGRGNGRERTRARQDKAGSGEKLNTVSVVCMKGGLGTNTGRSVRVSCAAPCLPPQYCLCPPTVHSDTENPYTATPGPCNALCPLCFNTGGRQDRTGQCRTTPR